MDGAPGLDPSAQADAGELALERAYGVELADLDRMTLDALAQQLPADHVDGSWDDVPGEIALTVLGSHPADLLVLADLDPHTLDPCERVIALGALDRAEALIAALRAELLVAVAGTRPSGSSISEIHVEAEVAIARGCSRYAAGRAIETARALATVFTGMAAALRAGHTSEAHARMLVERTRAVTDQEVLAAIEARVLPAARTLPVTAFGREVAKAVADLDPDAAARHHRALQQREVTARPLDDGLGLLTLIHDWPTISAIAQTLDADAATLRTDRGGPAAVAGGEHDARLGACRADALATRILGTVEPDPDSPGHTRITYDRATVPVTLDLVIDLATLRGEADRMARLAGQPVPASIARDWAHGAQQWRRAVTDPTDGHLLDYGTTQYLPAPLRRFILARDSTCRAPTCTITSPRRLQLDHAVPYPHGPSSAANTGAACITDHQLKTSGHLRLTHSRPDGSCTWTTTWGQTIHTPPHPYLHDPHHDRPEPTAPDPDPPLF